MARSGPFKVGDRPADLDEVGDAASASELANSILGALLTAVGEDHGEEGIEAVLREAGEHRPRSELEDASAWSTYEQGVALLRAAARVLDDPEIGYKAGRAVLRRYAGTEVVAILKSLGSPAELVRAYPAISAKQSAASRTEVLDVADGRGLISVVTTDHARERLLCDYTAGALSQFPVLFGMAPAEVAEEECQAMGDPRCLMRMTWDPCSRAEPDHADELTFLREQSSVLTQRFESLESVARELATIQDVDEMLETIIRHADVAARAPRHLLSVRLPGETSIRVHHVGFAGEQAATVAERILDDVEEENPSCLTVDIESPRTHFGRLAAFYPEGFPFLAQERSLLMAYAGHAAAALETAAALEDARDRNVTLSALLSLGRELAQDRTRAQVAQRLADAVPEIVRCTEAHVMIWDAGDTLLRRVASTSGPGEVPLTGPTAVRDGQLARRLLELSEPVLASAISDASLSSVVSLAGLHQGVVTPITARNELFGVLVVGSVGPGLDPSTRERLAGAASLAATALDSVVLLDEVRYQALHDPITDLANSRLFEDHVTTALSVARRSGIDLALLFADLDGFKIVNDRHGHKVGDELLKAVAERMQITLRAGDTIARLGGDEFGVLLQDVGHPEDALAVASKVISVIAAPFAIRGYTLKVGASIGVALFPEDLDTYESVICRADAAMYQAKADGRGRVRFAPHRLRAVGP